MDWKIWSADPPEGHCTLGPAFIEAWDEMREGQPVLGKLAGPVEVRMSDDFPDDLVVSDNMETSGYIVVSQRLKAHLEAHIGAARLEFLPTTVLNHKGRVAPGEYFVVHPLDIVDCIDLKASKVKWSPLNKARIASCKGLVLTPEALPADMPVFRPRHWSVLLMVSGALAASLEAAGFTGLYFSSASGYNGIT